MYYHWVYVYIFLLEYRGPAPDFPFKSYRVIGALKLLCSLALIIIAFVHMTLKEEDRGIYLMAAGIVGWAPLFVSTVFSRE